MSYCNKILEWLVSFFTRPILSIITSKTTTIPSNIITSKTTTIPSNVIPKKPFSIITLFISAHGTEDYTSPLHEYHDLDTQLLERHCTILSIAGTWNVIGILCATSLVKGQSLSENMLYAGSTLFTRQNTSYNLLLQECCETYRDIIGSALRNIISIGPTTPSIIIQQYIKNTKEEQGVFITILKTWLRQHLPKRLHSSIGRYVHAIHYELITGYHDTIHPIHPSILFTQVIKRISSIHPEARITSSQFIELYRQKDSEWYALIGSYLSNHACTLIRPYYNKTYQFFPNEKKESSSLRPHYGIHVLQMQSHDGKQWIPPLPLGKPDSHNLLSTKCTLHMIHPTIASLYSTFSRRKKCSLSLYDILIRLQPLADKIVLLDTSCRSDHTEQLTPHMEKRIRNSIRAYEKI